MAYRDSSGRTLADYPRPSVAVDTAVLTAAPGEPLSVVVTRHSGRVRLPGTFLHEGERLAQAVRRSLREKAGLTGVEPVQLHVFDRPGRDDRGWVLSVAHLATIPWTRAHGAGRDVVPVAQLPRMPYDHNEIVTYAVESLRLRYAEAADPYGLIDEPFTLRVLQQLHESVAGDRLMRDTFRRRMDPQLVPTGDVERGTVGKPARAFRRR